MLIQTSFDASEHFVDNSHVFYFTLYRLDDKLVRGCAGVDVP